MPRAQYQRHGPPKPRSEGEWRLRHDACLHDVRRLAKSPLSQIASNRHNSLSLMVASSKRMIAGWRQMRDASAMDLDEFAEFYGRYVAQCIRAMVKPLASDDAADLLAALAAGSDIDSHPSIDMQYR